MSKTKLITLGGSTSCWVNSISIAFKCSTLRNYTFQEMFKVDILSYILIVTSYI